ncbi:hypothetical protein ANCCEY_14058 [Ancylostoma ceylanicum]|uniref:Glycosyltransferase family 92 protein n=1 Tax=Ancylostoma ceylanicum TaxID=53326 RepID=A0A0D6L672_9BILA|nr:hypothetical protein ANCCEY_14058 [Ancylostoma ceylanicum]
MIGRYSRSLTSLSLVGAYAYDQYSVVTIDADGWFGRKVYCRYFDRNWVELEPTVDSVVFPEFVVHCCRHPEARYMSISESREQIVNEKVPVLDRTAKTPKYKLTFCLPPIYGNESVWLLIAELVEHYRLQGVDHFYFYIKDIDAYSSKLIENYVKNGEADAIYLKEEQDRDGYQWQLVGVRDCLHRNRHHSQYTIFSDLDERMMPMGETKLIDYARSTMRPNGNIGSIKVTARFIARSKELPKKYEGEETLRNSLPTLVFHNTSAIPYSGFSSKCIVDCAKVFIMAIHWTKAMFPPYQEIFAPREEILIMSRVISTIPYRHYRDFNVGIFPRRTLPILITFGPFQMTEYPSHLMERLYKNVEKRLRLVYLQS